MRVQCARVRVRDRAVHHPVTSPAQYRGGMGSDKPHGAQRWLLLFLRHGLPLLFLAGGILLVILGHAHVSDTSDTGSGSSVFTTIPTDRNSMYTAGGVGLALIAVMIWMVGWMMRLSTSSEKDRHREEEARDYFARTGRWPGERGPGPNHP